VRRVSQTQGKDLRRANPIEWLSLEKSTGVGVTEFSDTMIALGSEKQYFSLWD
jgi:hypothetical protein